MFSYFRIVVYLFDYLLIL